MPNSVSSQAQSGQRLVYIVIPCQLFTQDQRNATFSPKCTSELTCYRASRVSIVAEIDPFQHRFLKITCIMEGPQCRFQAFDDIPASLDGSQLLLPETTARSEEHTSELQS